MLNDDYQVNMGHLHVIYGGLEQEYAKFCRWLDKVKEPQQVYWKDVWLSFVTETDLYRHLGVYRVEDA